MSTTPTVDYDALAKQAGAISSQPAASGAVDYDALAKQSGATSSVPVSTSQPAPGTSGVLGVINKIGETGADVATGFVKGAGDTVSGVSHLLNKIPVIGETLAPSEGISALDQADQTHSTAEAAGKGLEGIAEFAAGDELLSGLSKGVRVVALARKYPIVAKTMELAAEHPILAKIILEGGKGAAVGAAQGAIKGAQAGDAVAGAEGGAAGGAIGGSLGGAVEGIATPKNPIESLTQAIRPTGKLAQNFADKAELALPRLAIEHANSPISNLDELSDAAHNAASNLWNNEIVPQIAKHAQETIPGKPVADAIRQGVLPGDADLFPDAAKAAKSFAKKFDSDMNLQQASDRLQSLNRKLSSLYKLDPASRYAATANQPAVEALESGANELRQQIYSKLESLGEIDPASQRKTYGALKTVEQAAEKRAAVVGRAAPLNIAQQLATIGGVLHAAGHLAVGDVPGAVVGAAPIAAAAATKSLNSPEHLIGNALHPEGGALTRLAQKAAMPIADIGSQGGQAVANSDTEGDQ